MRYETRYETTYIGPIDDGHGRPLSCPNCSRTTGHTIVGDPLKGSAELRCQARHTFPFPSDVNGLDRLLKSIADPRRIVTSIKRDSSP